jgi:hypothetical protein
MSQHTPGPWVVYEFVDGYDIRAPEAECYVATASDPEAVWGAIGREEDARLIAAAPDLLAGLEQAIWMLYGIGVDPEKPAMESFAAAIRKATGLE